MPTRRSEIPWLLFYALTPGVAHADLIGKSLTATTTFSVAQLGTPSAPGSGPSVGNYLNSPGNGLFVLGAQLPGTTTVSCSAALATCQSSPSVLGGSFQSGSLNAGYATDQLTITSLLQDSGAVSAASVNRTDFSITFTENSTAATISVNLGQTFNGVLPSGSQAAAAIVNESDSFLDSAGSGAGLGGYAWFAVANLGTGPVYYGSAGVAVTFTANSDGSVNYTATLPYLLNVAGIPLQSITIGGSFTEVAIGGASIASAALPVAFTPITFATAPSGLLFSVDGVTQRSAPRILNLPQGSHSIAVATSQTVNGAKFAFANWSDGGAASHTIVVDASLKTYTASFTELTSLVMFQTSPPGLQFTVDSFSPLTAPQTVSLSQGQHTIAVSSPQTGGTGVQFVFSGWSDGGAAAHTITVGPASATLTASFNAQYQFSIGVSNPQGGSVAPASGGFLNAGTVVTIAATVNTGYFFAGWSGGAADPGNPSSTVTMNGPETLTANFRPQTTVQTVPPGLQFTVDGGSVPLTSPQVLNLPPGSHSLTMGYEGTVGAVEYVFTGWSDGIATSSRYITVGASPATYTANFAVATAQLTVYNGSIGNAVNSSLGIFCPPHYFPPAPSCRATFPVGKVVTLSAVNFSEGIPPIWAGCSSLANNPNCTVTIQDGGNIIGLYDGILGVSPGGFDLAAVNPSTRFDGSGTVTVADTEGLCPNCGLVIVSPELEFWSQSLVEGGVVQVPELSCALAPTGGTVGLFLFGQAQYPPDYPPNGPALPPNVSPIHSFNCQTDPATIQFVSNNYQFGTTGQRLLKPLQVKVVDSSGQPFVANTPITFTVSSFPQGATGYGTTPALTAADGSAFSFVTLGDLPGVYGITVSCATCVSTLTFTATASSPQFTVVNPFADYAKFGFAPGTLGMYDVLGAPQAGAVAADGVSAVVLVYQSQSPAPVTFSLGTSSPGFLAYFDPSYLQYSQPSPYVYRPNQITVLYPTYKPDADNSLNYVFLVIFGASGGAGQSINVTASQSVSGPVAGVSVGIMPPPLLLVHGVWSSAQGAGFWPGAGGFYDWIVAQPPYSQNTPPLVYPVDYGSLNSEDFGSPQVQKILLTTMGDALAGAANANIAARTVDVVGHSMGGLVTRYFLSNGGYAGNGALVPNPVHSLITIGTPHMGSALATTLVANAPQVVRPEVIAGVDIIDPTVARLCVALCTLGNLMAGIGRPIGAAVASLDPNSGSIKSLQPQDNVFAIVGLAPEAPQSDTERLLNTLIGAFLPGQTVQTILGPASDTIVPLASQAPAGRAGTTVISGIVHTNLCDVAPVPGCQDVGETRSASVWEQAYNWLTGQVSGASAASAAKLPTPAARKSTAKAAPAVLAPVLDLSAYTLVDASNVAFSPPSGSTLAIGNAGSISATSSTKTLTEVLLLQNVVDPADPLLLYSTQSPFNVGFTPTRLGTSTFNAFAVFSDQTYATTTLTYTLQPDGNPTSLTFVNAPLANMQVGDSQVIEVSAVYPSGAIDVTQAATYAARSGSANVLSISSGGSIRATGDGVDLLDVSYGGVTATTQIAVGRCSYALGPGDQLVPSTGGPVALQVTTQSGCAWTAGGGTTWLPVANASGSGNGILTLSAAANNSGLTLSTLVTVGDQTSVVTQSATACSYNLSQTSLNVPAAGASGSINVTTSCPVVSSSNQSWLTAVPSSSSVAYNIAPNGSTSPRSATLTIGSANVPVTQAGNTFACSVSSGGTTGVADVQQMINGILGMGLGASDLNEDGLVNVADVQIVLNAAVGRGCAAQ